MLLTLTAHGVYCCQVCYCCFCRDIVTDTLKDAIAAIVKDIIHVTAKMLLFPLFSTSLHCECIIYATSMDIILLPS